MMEYLNETIIKSLLNLIDRGLCYGLGNGVPGAVCIEAAVCMTFENRNDDNPKCVAPILRDFKVRLNDTYKWGSNQARARGLRRLGVAQLGTRDNFNDEEFAKELAILVYNLAIKKTLLVEPPPVSKWEELADKGKSNVIQTMGLDYLSWAIANIQDHRFGNAAMRLASVIKEIATDSASLAAISEEVVQILVKMKTPGVEFLYLTEEQPEGPKNDEETTPQTIQRQSEGL